MRIRVGMPWAWMMAERVVVRMRRKRLNFMMILEFAWNLGEFF